MALLESINIPLGTVMPSFELPDPSGKFFASQDLFGSKGLLVAFTCNHCPYAIAVWPRLISLAVVAKKLGVNTAAINPNIHPNYPEDAPYKMEKKIAEWQIPFPYLIDESQQIAKNYDAQCTPDLYLLDAQGKLVYHGRIDDNWKDESEVTSHELEEAIKNLSAGEPINTKQFPTTGCSIKWK